MRFKSSSIVLAALAALSSCREPRARPEATGAVLPSRNEPPTAALPDLDKRVEPRAESSARIVAHKSRGAPLHAAPNSPSVSGRLADGADVRVEELSPDGRWFRVRAADGASGWVVARYLDRVPQSAPPSASSLPSATPRASAPAGDSPWISKERCETLVRSASRAPRGAGHARIGAWNLHWFPDGRPGLGSVEGTGSDVGWLGCAIAFLDLDVLVVEEIKTHPGARARLAELIAALDRYTQGTWKAELDRCPIEAAQHVGFLYDSKRVTALGFQTFAVLNPYGQACKDQLRPGFGGYFRFRGGLDLNLVSVHLKSGSERRAFELRQKSWAGIAELFAAAQAQTHDPDVLLAGDFNTMGCRHCSPAVSAEAELDELGHALAGLRAPFRRVACDGGCSEYFEGSATLLDHFVASNGLAELPDGRRAIVSGYCADVACRALERHAMPAAYEKLSDHCPIVLELDDRDLD